MRKRVRNSIVFLLLILVNIIPFNAYAEGLHTADEIKAQCIGINLSNGATVRSSNNLYYCFFNHLDNMYYIVLGDSTGNTYSSATLKITEDTTYQGYGRKYTFSMGSYYSGYTACFCLDSNLNLIDYDGTCEFIISGSSVEVLYEEQSKTYWHNATDADVYNTYSLYSTGQLGDDEELPSDDNGITVNIDLSETNSFLAALNDKVNIVNGHLVNIQAKLDSCNDCLTIIKNALFVDNISITSWFKSFYDFFRNDFWGLIEDSFTDLQTNIDSNFQNLVIYLNSKFEGVYNVVMYGNPEGDDSDIVEYENKLESFNADFASFNGNISSAGGMVESAGANAAAYIINFANFYSQTEQIVGLGAILTLGLAIIFVSKVIGR